MIYLEKKSIVELPKTQGSISDTLNVEDKVRNAPSINLVQEMVGIPQEGIIAFDGNENEIPEGYEKIEQDEILPLTVFSKTIQASEANTWYDVGIQGEDLTTGTYIMEVNFWSFAGISNIWSESCAGVVFWYSYGTNSEIGTEIPIHINGHATNGTIIKLRTLRQASYQVDDARSKLQILFSVGMTEAREVTFKFRKMI